MGGGLESRCVGRVCGANVAVTHTPLPQPGEHKTPVPTKTDLYNTP